MLIGQTVFAPGPGATYYSPWFPRQGDAFTGVFEVIEAMSPYSLVCEAETKNAEDADSSATGLTGSVTINGTAWPELGTINPSAAKELVRFKFTASGDGESTAAWIHFRSNAPIWQPN